MDHHSYQIVPIHNEIDSYEIDPDALERFLKSPDRQETQQPLISTDSPDPDDPLTWNLDSLDFACHDDDIVAAGDQTVTHQAGLLSNYETQGQSEAVPLSVWPFNFNCSCCQVLREFVHSDGGRVIVKLEIHGGVGIISHAIVETRQYFADRQPESHIQMTDFGGRSLEEVRQWIKEYCIRKEREGFFLEQDNLSKFYEAMCVGYDWNDILELNSPVETANGNQVPQEESEGERQAKSNLSLQRERASKLKVKDLAVYFDYPILTASMKLNLCATVLKRKCRQEGVRRWPYRKVNSLKRQMKKVREFMNGNDHNRREYARLQGQLDKLQQQLDVIFSRGY